MSKQFWGILVVIALIFVGVVLINGNGSSGGGTPTNHVEGKSPKGVTLVEYGDYQCPVCGNYYPTVKSIVDQYSDRVKFQFRNFPITSAHPNAFAAARAAEAAGLQGKFWEMNDTLYKNQDIQGASGWVASSDPLNQYFVDFAKQLKLNVAKFTQDYASTKVNNLINADIAAAKKLNVSGTPTFFLNGKKIELRSLVDTSGQPQPDKFAKLLDDALKSK